jgi:hypothetical protein
VAGGAWCFGGLYPGQAYYWINLNQLILPYFVRKPLFMIMSEFKFVGKKNPIASIAMGRER